VPLPGAAGLPGREALGPRETDRSPVRRTPPRQRRRKAREVDRRRRLRPLVRLPARDRQGPGDPRPRHTRFARRSRRPWLLSSASRGHPATPHGPAPEVSMALQEQTRVETLTDASRDRGHAMPSALIPGKYVLHEGGRTQRSRGGRGRRRVPARRDDRRRRAGRRAPPPPSGRPGARISRSRRAAGPRQQPPPRGAHAVSTGSPDHPLEPWLATRLAARDVDPYLDTLYSAFEIVKSASSHRQRTRS
jgi:hypothetical protein